MKYRDHTAVIRAGEVQRISAGTGIAHSEFNHSQQEPVHFLQIWLLPSRKGFPPGYAQQSFGTAPQNTLTLVCSPDGRQQSISLNQDVQLYLGKLTAGGTVAYSLGEQRHGWVQLI